MLKTSGGAGARPGSHAGIACGRRWSQRLEQACLGPTLNTRGKVKSTPTLYSTRPKKTANILHSTRSTLKIKSSRFRAWYSEIRFVDL